MSGMRPQLLDAIEGFFEEGSLWNGDALGELIARLDAETAETGDPLPERLGRFLRSVHLRMQLGEIPRRTRDDIEAIVYPRVWKLMEAARDDLPAGELQTRLEVMNRRLSRLFARE